MWHFLANVDHFWRWPHLLKLRRLLTCRLLSVAAGLDVCLTLWIRYNCREWLMIPLLDCCRFETLCGSLLIRTKFFAVLQKVITKGATVLILGGGLFSMFAHLLLSGSIVVWLDIYQCLTALLFCAKLTTRGQIERSIFLRRAWSLVIVTNAIKARSWKLRLNLW